MGSTVGGNGKELPMKALESVGWISGCLTDIMELGCFSLTNMGKMIGLEGNRCC